MSKTKPENTAASEPKPKTPRRRKTPAPAQPPEIATVLQAAHDKKASDVVLLDLRHADGFTDFFVICSGQSNRQIKAIADGIEEQLRKEHGLKPSHVEGYARAEWILLDYFDFIVHVFHPETREFYGLERLWGSAERTEVPAPEPAPHAARAR